MEYFVRFADGRKEMVVHTFGPMTKLIEAYEKEQAKKKPTDGKMAKDGKKSSVNFGSNFTNGY